MVNRCTLVLATVVLAASAIPVPVGTLGARDNKVTGVVKNAGHQVIAVIRSPKGQAVVQTVQNVAAVGERILPFIQKHPNIAAGAEKALPLAETVADMLRARDPTFAAPGTLEARDNKAVNAIKNAGHRAKAAIQSPKGQAVVRTTKKVAAVGQAVAPFAMLVLREAEPLSERYDSDDMYNEID